MTHLDLEKGTAKLLTSPTVVGGSAFVCLSSDFGDAQVRVALKHRDGGWEVHDHVSVTSAGDHTVVAKIDSTITKISVLVESLTTTNAILCLDMFPDHPL
jgi:hypothetical protein